METITLHPPGAGPRADTHRSRRTCGAALRRTLAATLLAAAWTTAAGSAPPPIVRTAPGAVSTLPPQREGQVNVYFLPESSAMPPHGAELLGVVAELAEARPGRIAITGHADPAERTDARRLSVARAELVAAALVGRGIDRRRIEVRAAGAGNPAVPSGRKGNARNRRVEINLGLPEG
ncbi:OmpA family protein [Sphingomonas parva]|nr:OmpA family protein [Sphingomonas parva]